MWQGSIFLGYPRGFLFSGNQPPLGLGLPFGQGAIFGLTPSFEVYLWSKHGTLSRGRQAGKGHSLKQATDSASPGTHFPGLRVELFGRRERQEGGATNRQTEESNERNNRTTTLNGTTTQTPLGKTILKTVPGLGPPVVPFVTPFLVGRVPLLK